MLEGEGAGRGLVIPRTDVLSQAAGRDVPYLCGPLVPRVAASIPQGTCQADFDSFLKHPMDFGYFEPCF